MAKILKSSKIILASGSPRRRELLATLFDDFEVVIPNADEIKYHRFPSRLVVINARAKVSEINDDKAISIAADTVVFKSGKYYFKPKSDDDAREMLKSLRGKTHYVYTGVFIRIGNELISFYVKSAVKFNNFDDNTIENYILTGSPMDKAGAYGIQDNILVKSYQGSYSNIMGLPLEKLTEVLNKYALLQ